jgi:hypothetical protein
VKEYNDRVVQYGAFLRDDEEWILDVGELVWAQDVLAAMTISLAHSKWEDREEYQAALQVVTPLVRSVILHAQGRREI